MPIHPISVVEEASQIILLLQEAAQVPYAGEEHLVSNVGGEGGRGVCVEGDGASIRQHFPVKHVYIASVAH
jgi:hypothetical protein